MKKQRLLADTDKLVAKRGELVRAGADTASIDKLLKSLRVELENTRKQYSTEGDGRSARRYRDRIADIDRALAPAADA